MTNFSLSDEPSTVCAKIGETMKTAQSKRGRRRIAINRGESFFII
jgi:hypothetical protein